MLYLDHSMEPKVAIEWMSKGVLKTEAQTKTLEKLDDIEQKEQGFFFKTTVISGLAFAILGFFKEGCYGALKGAALGTVLSLSSLGLWSKFFSETAIVQKALERHNAAAQVIYDNARDYLKSKTNEPKIFNHGVLEKGEHKTLEAQARILYNRDIMMTACRNYYESCKPPAKNNYY